jgi:membrane-associated phospholipid phosphatase
MEFFTARVKWLLWSSLFALFLVSCEKDKITTTTTTPKAVSEYDSKVPQEWNNLFLEIERYAAVYRPCPAARMLGYVGLALYEAEVSGMPGYQSLAPHLGITIPKAENGKEYDWAVVANAVYATMYKRFFYRVKETDFLKITALESEINAKSTKIVASDVFLRSKTYGTQVAEAVWSYSATDTEGHDKYLDPRPTSYVPPTGLGKWQPTPPGNHAAMFPYWSKARTFAVKGSEKIARPPLEYSESKTSPYYAQGLEIYAATKPQTYHGRWIGEFWSDDVLGFTFSPPSRWVAIGNQALAQSQSNLETAVMMLVKVGLALNDASVACWASKYTYNIERPVSYIQKVIDPLWSISPLTTNSFLSSSPSFPAYPSGHSTFGAAAAEALTSVFGMNYAMTDHCHEKRTDFNGTPRSFNSFYEMAEENAISRIYIGVHWRMDCEEGLRLGYLCGRRVNGLPFKK